MCCKCVISSLQCHGHVSLSYSCQGPPLCVSILLLTKVKPKVYQPRSLKMSLNIYLRILLSHGIYFSEDCALV